jgi:uncharacterized surface protein with fasciclin (FAS1) repeats
MDRRAVVAVVAAAVMGVAVVLAVGAGQRAAPSRSATRSGGSAPAGAGAAGDRSTGSRATDPASAGLVGPGCADYLAAVGTGRGSVAAMAAEPLTSALAENPLLGTFDRALTGHLNRQVVLTAALRGGNLTVFAPIDSAYAALSPVALQQLTQSPTALRKALSYLLVRGRLTPTLVGGAHASLAGVPIRVGSSAGTLQVGSAHVVCGGLRTRDATVYLLDAVPLPRAGSAG